MSRLGVTKWVGTITKLTDAEVKWLDDATTWSAEFPGERPWFSDDHLSFDYESFDSASGEIGRFSSLEDGNLAKCCLLIQAFLKAFRPLAVWSCTWSDLPDNTCSGQFGGGYCVVTADRIILIDVNDVARNIETAQRQRMERESTTGGDFQQKVTFMDAELRSLNLENPVVLRAIAEFLVKSATGPALLKAALDAEETQAEKE